MHSDKKIKYQEEAENIKYSHSMNLCLSINAKVKRLLVDLQPVKKHLIGEVDVFFIKTLYA